LTPHYTDHSVTLYHGDCLDILRDLPDCSVDAVVTDPPYSLTFMGRDWDRHETPAAFQQWCELWATECLRVLKPGGHMLAFGGTRTSHRLACAVEDAGFEIRDSIAWLYGSGFPKSHNLTGQWQGWGTALKPAFEPIVVARKPLTGTVAGNVQAWGTGALNVDACRIGDGFGVVTFDRAPRAEDGSVYDLGTVTGVRASGQGRWPANVILDEHQADALDQQSGEQRDGFHVGRNRDATQISNEILGARRKDASDSGYGGSGGASRFMYTAKADAGERVRVDGIAHPTVKPLSLMRWLVRLVTPPGGTVLEPFAGSGTTVEACILEGLHCIAIEREADYLPLIVQRVNRQRDPIAYTATAGEDLGLFELFTEGELA
jgi:site-specific DNA-methyltransferase (adenine-specific)